VKIKTEEFLVVCPVPVEFQMDDNPDWMDAVTPRVNEAMLASAFEYRALITKLPTFVGFVEDNPMFPECRIAQFKGEGIFTTPHEILPKSLQELTQMKAHKEWSALK
jgi:hypothetical protein